MLIGIRSSKKKLKILLGHDFLAKNTSFLFTYVFRLR